jgi:hypothetical protein
MLEYEDNKLHLFDSTYNKSTYDAYFNKVLPIVQEFISNRNDVHRIVFPICVPVLDNNDEQFF